MPNYRHVHLRSIGTASDRFRPRTGGGDPDHPDPVRNRGRHADQLRQSLDAVIGTMNEVSAAQKDNGIPLGQRGMAIAVEARADQRVFLGDMRLETRGLKLLSVQRGGDGADIANVFITKTSAEGLSRALGKYQRWVDGDRPRRFWFFESVQGFGPADVASLWTDPIEALERQGRHEAAWEVWVRRSASDTFLKTARRLGVETVGGFTDFVDSSVITVMASRAVLNRLIQQSGAVAELRTASNFVATYLQFDPQARYGEVNRLAALVTPAPPGAVRTTILDTGVNHANPLLRGSLPPDRCHTINEAWGADDHDGHGTNMAGVALFGDIAGLAEADEPFHLTTALESVVLAAPMEAHPMPAHSAIASAVAMVAADPTPRVFSLAATAPTDVDSGQQTSTSATVDKLAWNDGGDTRLFCVAAGNVYTSALEPYEVAHYDDRNADHRLQSPGQALNALTIGGTTAKLGEGADMVAPEGDLSPTSRTAQNWSMRYANKPDVVMEGGNHRLHDDGDSSSPDRSAMVLTTHRDIPRFPLSFTGETSAATACAAGVASRLAAAYPNLRAETLRGMMVHNAEWTPAMRRRFEEASRQGRQRSDSWASVVECFGWGVPDERRLHRSAGDALTMIIEDELLPFEMVDGKIRLRQMKYFELPWPVAALDRIGRANVELRCTLSYFVEPDPHAGSRYRLDRYASHRLRFNLKSDDDSHDEAQRRINALAELDEGSIVVGPGAGDRGWCLGKNRRGYGSLHHDIWEGQARELAKRDGISVYPAKGWWAERKEERCQTTPARFSLIMSIRTRRSDVDLVAETAAAIRARNMTRNLVENVAVV